MLWLSDPACPAHEQGATWPTAPRAGRSASRLRRRARRANMVTGIATAMMTVADRPMPGRSASDRLRRVPGNRYHRHRAARSRQLPRHQRRRRGAGGQVRCCLAIAARSGARRHHWGAGGRATRWTGTRPEPNLTVTLTRELTRAALLILPAGVMRSGAGRSSSSPSARNSDRDAVRHRRRGRVHPLILGGWHAAKRG
jgi:hypothetical protein